MNPDADSHLEELRDARERLSPEEAARLAAHEVVCGGCELERLFRESAEAAVVVGVDELRWARVALAAAEAAEREVARDQNRDQKRWARALPMWIRSVSVPAVLLVVGGALAATVIRDPRSWLAEPRPPLGAEGEPTAPADEPTGPPEEPSRERTSPDAPPGGDVSPPAPELSPSRPGAAAVGPPEPGPSSGGSPSGKRRGASPLGRGQDVEEPGVGGLAAGWAAGPSKGPVNLDALLEGAARLRQEGSFRASLSLLKEVIELAPRSVEADVARVSAGWVCLDGLNRPEEAARHFSDYVERGRMELSEEALIGWARAERRLQRAGREVEVLRRLVERHPHGLHAATARGRLLELGEPGE